MNSLGKSNWNPYLTKPYGIVSPGNQLNASLWITAALSAMKANLMHLPSDFTNIDPIFF